MDQRTKASWPLGVVADALGVRPRALVRWQDRRRLKSSECRCGRPAIIDVESQQAIRKCYVDHYGQWGPRVLAQWCKAEGLGDWSHGTIADIIADLRPEKEPKATPVRYEMTASNVMWSEDGTGFRQQGRKQELLVVQDEHSRLKLNWELVDGPAKSPDVCYYLECAFHQYGAPLVLKHDGDRIFHTPEVRALLDRHQVLDLTSPAHHPGYNGKQERSMRDIKSYERAMRKYGEKGSLRSRIRVAMTDLNEDRPRPVLDGQTARKAYESGANRLPDRHQFRAEVESRLTSLLATARSRGELMAADRKAIEQALWSHGLMSIEGKVSPDFLLDVGTE